MIIVPLEGKYNAIRMVLNWEADCLLFLCVFGVKMEVEGQLDGQSGRTKFDRWTDKSGFLGYCMERGHKYRFFEIEA